MFCTTHSLTAKSTNSPPPRSLSLSVMEAKDFGKFPLPYCIISLNGIKYARVPAKKDAFWGEDFVFEYVCFGKSALV